MKKIHALLALFILSPGLAVASSTSQARDATATVGRGARQTVNGAGQGLQNAGVATQEAAQATGNGLQKPAEDIGDSFANENNRKKRAKQDLKTVQDAKNSLNCTPSKKTKGKGNNCDIYMKKLDNLERCLIDKTDNVDSANCKNEKTDAIQAGKQLDVPPLKLNALHEDEIRK